jgi:chemotaxis protein methyltransferase CheR
MLHLHALANIGEILPAEAIAAEAVREHPLDPNLAFAHAMLLVGLDRHADAVAALRRTIYLDRSLAAAHVALGQILHRLGDVTGAMRALRIGYDLAMSRSPDEVVPLTDGETAGRMAAAAKAHLALNAEATMDRAQ